jgi:hypothetical protein
MTSSCQQQSTNVGVSKRGGDTRKNKEQEAVEAKEYMQGNTSRAVMGMVTYHLMTSVTMVGRVMEAHVGAVESHPGPSTEKRRGVM